MPYQAHDVVEWVSTLLLPTLAVDPFGVCAPSRCTPFPSPYSYHTNCTQVLATLPNDAAQAYLLRPFTSQYQSSATGEHSNITYHRSKHERENERERESEREVNMKMGM